jgi:hypothetical protein
MKAIFDQDIATTSIHVQFDEVKRFFMYGTHVLTLLPTDLPISQGS